MSSNWQRYIPLSLIQLTENIEKEIGKRIIFSYGGDGKLLSTLRDNSKYYSTSIIYPIRNYGNCELHTFDKIFDNITEKNFSCLKEKIKHDTQIIPILKIKSNIVENEVASEFVIKNSNPTQCLRLNILVNKKMIYENAICDGIIVSTDLIGSHGYFKSVTRTTFKNGIGFAFINPTYGLTNCILNTNDVLKVQIIRETEITACFDTQYGTYPFKEYDEITIQKDPYKKPLIVGYDDFMCYKCRMNRNSTKRINDYYI